MLQSYIESATALPDTLMVYTASTLWAYTYAHGIRRQYFDRIIVTALWGLVM